LILILSGPASSVLAPSTSAASQAQLSKPAVKAPQSPQLAASDIDADVTAPRVPAPPLPEKIPTSLLSDQPIQPSPLAGVRNLPYVPPSPDTKPEFEIALLAAKVSSGAVAPAPPHLVLAPMPDPIKAFNGLDFNSNGAVTHRIRTAMSIPPISCKRSILRSASSINNPEHWSLHSHSILSGPAQAPAQPATLPIWATL